MSHYSNIPTEFVNTDCLVQALVDMGFAKEVIEVHKEPVHLMGFQGDERDDLAHVVVRRRYVGSASNDLGFIKGKDGHYTAIISEFDSNKYNSLWVRNLTARYVVNVGKKRLEAKGFKTTQEIIDDAGRVHVVGRRFR